MGGVVVVGVALGVVQPPAGHRLLAAAGQLAQVMPLGGAGHLLTGPQALGAVQSSQIVTGSLGTIHIITRPLGAVLLSLQHIHVHLFTMLPLCAIHFVHHITGS